MNVLLFGATGMIGQGVLRACLLDPTVTRVISVSRRPTGKSDPKLHEFVQGDVTNLSPLGVELKTIDACLFTLGVSSVGQSEAEYTRTTYDLTMKVAEQCVKANPSMTFIYVSGRSTDSTENGSAISGITMQWQVDPDDLDLGAAFKALSDLVGAYLP